MAELGEIWIVSQSHLKPSSMAVVESAWRLHVKPTWGKMSVGEIRHSEVQTWVARLADGVGHEGKPKSAALVHRAHGALFAVLEVAVRDRRIAANPASGIGLPRRISRPNRYLTHEQVHQLAEACGDHATLIRLLAYTCLRWGEATALTVHAVDRRARRIRISRNAVLVNGMVIVGTPKSHKQRSVPYPAILDESIYLACESKPDDALLFPGPTDTFQITP